MLNGTFKAKTLFYNEAWCNPVLSGNETSETQQKRISSSIEIRKVARGETKTKDYQVGQAKVEALVDLHLSMALQLMLERK